MALAVFTTDKVLKGEGGSVYPLGFYSSDELATQKPCCC
jgi:hypothetical protein